MEISSEIAAQIEKLDKKYTNSGKEWVDHIFNTEKK